MTKHRRITGFLAVALLAAVASALTLKSHPSKAVSNAPQAELGRTQSRLEQKKPIRYEAIIENWKRYRSAART